MNRFIFIILFWLIISYAYSDSETTIGGATGASHIIQNSGTTLRQRPYLNFTGSGISCTDSGGKTVCGIDGNLNQATDVTADTATFSNILSSTDNTVQKALNKIDDSITSSAPSSTTSACTPSQLAFQSGYLYACIAANTWQRVALAAWSLTDVLLLDDGASKLLLDDGLSFLLLRH